MRFRLQIWRFLHYRRTNIPLRWMLVVPFMLQMVGVVTLVGYLSYQSGQQAVMDLADRLMNQTSDRINDRLSTYLQTPQQIVQLNRLAIEQKSLNINNPNQLKQHFLQQIKSFPALTSIGWGDVQGNEIFVARDKAGIFAPSGSFLLLEHKIRQKYYIYLIDSKGNPQKLLHSGTNYSTTQLPWYQAAVKAGKQVWTPIYPYAGVSLPGMNFSAPVNQNGKFQGVLTSNVILSDLNLLLKSLRLPSGQVFIIDRSGNLVATSTQEAPFVIANKKLVRLKASNSHDELTRLTAQYLLNKWHNLNQIQTPRHFYLPIRGKGLFAEVRPFRDSYGLDWLVVTVIPESDFMGKIQSNRNTTVLLCLLTLGLAIGSGTLMANCFSFRINRLNRLSHALAAGDLQQRLPADSPVAEVRGLAESINRMADQLQLSFIRLRNAKEESEEKFTTIFRASPDPIAITTLAEGRFLEINNQAIEFYGYSREEVIGRTSLELGLWANLEQRQLFKQQLQDRGRVSNLEVTTPTKSGELKVVLLSAELCNLQGQDAVIIIIRDISDRKLAEISLKQSQTSFQELSEASPAYIYILVRRVDGSFYFEYISRVIETIDEISVEQILEDANYLLDRIHPEDRAGYEAAAQHSLETLQPFRHEWRIITPSGKHKWLQGSSRPKLRDNGEIAWYGVAIDITEQQAALHERKLAEIALSQREEQLQTIAANIPGYLCRLVIHPDGTTLVPYLSPRAEQIYGLPVATLQADPTHWFSLIHPEDQPLMEAAIAAGAQTLKPLNLEFRVLSPDGQLKWINGTAQFYRTEAMDTVMDGIGLDVTDRKQAEIACSESEERFREIANTIHQMFFVRSLNPDRFVYISPTYESIFGHSPDEVLKNPWAWTEAIHPDDRNQVQAFIASKMQKNQQFNFEVEYRIVRPDGTVRWIKAEISVIRDQEGNPLRFIGLVEDISDRKQAEIALQESEARYRILCEVSPVAIFRFDQPLNCVYVNDRWSEMTGRSKESALGKGWIDTLHPDERENLLVFWTKKLLQATPLENLIINQGEGRHLRPDGTINWYYVQVAQEIDSAGKVVGYVGTLTDITDRKIAEQELSQTKAAAESANQAKSAFLANMSHELRTPLHAILGFAQLIERDTNLTPDYQKYIKIIHDSGNYLLKLINEILDLSKIEAGKLTLENQAIDLFDLLQSLHNTFSQQVSNQELQVNLEILPKVPQYIIVDPQKLQQVLINLIGNAIKFTNSGSVILQVSLANPTQDKSPFFLHFQVQDTGIGIAQEDLQMIFDAFAQTPTGRQAQQGTGLGLTISRRLVQLMGGEITVSSSLGKGSTFGFTIPVQIAKETALQPQQSQQQVIGLAPNQPTYRILVVDDQTENRLLLITLLTQVGLEVQEAASGEEALLLWQQWHPHLIFMDLRMPGLNGYETTKLIRAKEQKNQELERPFSDYSTIIIALTAQTSIVNTPFLEYPTGLYCTLREPTQAKVAGFDDHISKPFPAEILFSKIAEHLGICYIYAEDSQNLPNDQTLVVDENRMRENLALMPHDWVIKLYQASRACQHKVVKQLINHIPAEYPSLALGLEQLNQDFDFEKIMQLTAMYLDIHSD